MADFVPCGNPRRAIPKSLPKSLFVGVNAGAGLELVAQTEAQMRLITV
ncbi:hypothetical protein SAMN05421753_1247 [Planctomicrobium piriforme]|uniref:Uncharacterized protein n=1 Tax=Planctomicrobium piriforme TaxID=1576369 RepID=A0A1I3SIC8_9PLAN|nr:hypothetical protein SAMN05421753_1247 [Planctomicrobium piriforme]